MRLLLTIGDLSITGGAERVVVNLANAFAARGHSVAILSFYRANENLPYELDSRVICHFWHEASEAEIRARYRSKIAKIYHKLLYKFALNLRIYRAFSDFDAVIASDWTFAPFLRHKATRYIKIQHLGFRRYQRRCGLFDTLVVLTHREVETWRRYHKNVCVIPNFLPKKEGESAALTQKIVLSIGRMDDDAKGFLRLIDIWARLSESAAARDWRLIIIGEGRIRATIEEKIAALKLEDSITLKPFTRDVKAAYLGASIYAMTSHIEGFPMVLLEAGSLGLPCVAFDISAGPSEIIEDKRSGFLLEDGDLEGFGAAILALMESENLRRAFGAAAKSSVEGRFGKDRVVRMWEEVLG